MVRTPPRDFAPLTMKLCIHLLAVLALALIATAGRAEWLLKSNSARVEAGRPIELEVVVLNDTQAPMAPVFPERLSARVTAGDRAIPAELVRSGSSDSSDAPRADAPLAPGAFRKMSYLLALPPDIEGPIVLALESIQAGIQTSIQTSPLTLIAVRPPPIGGETIAAAPRTSGAVDTRPEPALQTYEPFYFVVGRRRDETTAKFQLSFRYRLFDERGPIGAVAPPLAKLYFGYTQTSLWNLTEESKPFTDTAYRPSFFYFEPAVWTSPTGRHNLALDGGFEHESNGRGEPQSRSINTLYIRPAWRMFLDANHYVVVAPKLWTYLDRDENPDIQRYRGYFDLNLRVGRVDGLQLSTHYRKGTDTFGAVQVDLSYPIRRPFFADAGGYLLFQYFNGYGESFIDYNIRGPAQYRVGFAIVR
jgi:phospholipase A1